MVETEVVREEVGNPALERVELGERVLPQAEQEVRAQAGLADRRRELAGEASLRALALVVEEELLELVEDHVEVPAHDPRRGGERLHERASALEADRVLDRRLEAALRVTRPRREDDDRGVVHGPERVRDRGAKERGLSHAARAVQDCQARGHQVRHDDVALALAPAEEERVELGVLKGRQALEGSRNRSGRDAHRAPVGWAVRWRLKVSAYCSNGSSTTSTSRRRQNSRSSGFGSGCTAHER